MNFTQALWELMLGSSGRIAEGYTGSALLVFATGSALMGLIAVALDWLVFSTGRRSIFGMTYGDLGNTFRLVFLWGAGSCLGGFLGSAGSIVQPTRLACIMMAVGWPLMLARLIDSNTRKEDQQEPSRDLQQPGGI
jgi:hypothetical protein